MKLGFHGLQPRAVAALLEPLDKADSATDFQAVLEGPDINVFAHEFEGSARGSRIEREKSVAIIVIKLFPRLGIPDWPYLLHTSLVKLHRLPQDPFGVDLGRFSSGLLRCRYSSGDGRF